MPHSTLSSSTLMRPFVVLALPGMYLLYKYNQYRQQQMETARRRVTERELLHLNHKIEYIEKPKDNMKKSSIFTKMKTTVKQQTKSYTQVKKNITVTILGAEIPSVLHTTLLLKTSRSINSIKLFNAVTGMATDKILTDLYYIDTPCEISAHGSSNEELDVALQDADIVLMVDNYKLKKFEDQQKKFYENAECIRRYAEACRRICPTSVICVQTKPLESTVPVVVEVLKRHPDFNPASVIGPLTDIEVRAKKILAKELNINPDHITVPIIGGSEGVAFVPAFSICNNSITEKVAARLTAKLRQSNNGSTLCDAYSQAVTVLKIANALRGNGTAILNAVTYNDNWQMFTRYFASPVKIDKNGLLKHMGVPKLSSYEVSLVDIAVNQISKNIKMAEKWMEVEGLKSLRMRKEGHSSDNTFTNRF